MITLQDIAKRVGVSQAVVSTVLNNRLGKIRVNEEKRLRILQVAAELGYVPNRSARTLVTKRNHAIGLVVNYPRMKQITPESSIYIMSILNGMHQICDPLSYRCVYALADMQSEAAFQMPGFIKERSVDAVLLAGYVNREVERHLIASGIPLLHVGTNVDACSQLKSIAADMEKAACDTLDEASRHGLTQVHLYLPKGPGPEKISAAYSRHAREHHPHLNATFAHSPHSQWNIEETCKHAAHLATRRPSPQLIITNHVNGQFLLSEFEKEGLSCPEDIQLILFAPAGFNEARFGTSYLQATQWVLDFKEIGSRMTYQLIQQLDGGPIPEDTLVPCQFLSGETALINKDAAKKDTIDTASHPFPLF